MERLKEESFDGVFFGERNGGNKCVGSTVGCVILTKP